MARERAREDTTKLTVPTTSTTPTTEAFIIPSSNVHDHSVRIQSRVQPAIDRQMQIVLESKAWDYHTKSDILRHAIHRHLEWLTTQKPIPSVMQRVHAMEALLSAEAFSSSFTEIFARVSDQVNQAISLRRTGIAKALIAAMKSQIDKMPDDMWRAEYLEEFLARFANLLDEGARINLLTGRSDGGGDGGDGEKKEGE